MCLQDIKIALKQQTRATVVSCANGTTTQVAGAANNRVRIRIAISQFAGVIANLNIQILYLGDSTAVGVGFIGSGVSHVELSLQDHSQFVKGPFSAFNNTGGAVSLGISEVLQNTNPEDAI